MNNLLTENCILPPINALTEQRNLLRPDPAQSTERAQRICALTERWQALKQERVQSDERAQRIRALTERWNVIKQGGAPSTERAQPTEREQPVRARTADLESTNGARHEENGGRKPVEFEFDRARDAAEAVEVAKSAFRANLSHEIRTPMIGVKRTAGVRSTFWSVIELNHASEIGPKLTLTPSFLENRRVLIVDDNATSRRLLDHLCTAWGLRHRMADSAAAALSHLRWAAHAEAPFDLVILDHHMPDADGLVLAKAILADSAIPRPTLVLLTSNGERLPQAQMDLHGITACELKPIHPDKLRTTLGRTLAAARRPAPADAPAAPCVIGGQPDTLGATLDRSLTPESIAAVA